MRHPDPILNVPYLLAQGQKANLVCGSVTVKPLTHKVAAHVRRARQKGSGAEVLLGDFNICPRLTKELYHELKLSVGTMTNLAEGIPWTCDLRMGDDPCGAHVWQLGAGKEIYQPKHAATMDHCWVSRSVTERGTACTARQILVWDSKRSSLNVSDHLGLFLEIPFA